MHFDKQVKFIPHKTRKDVQHKMRGTINSKKLREYRNRKNVSCSCLHERGNEGRNNSLDSHLRSRAQTKHPLVMNLLFFF